MQYGELTWPAIDGHAHKVVVVPIGSLEQHGHHLPLLTDTLIGGEVARRAEAALGEEAMFLPPLWVGASDHHRSFPGTISLSSAVYIQVLQEILDCLIAAGFRRIVLLNAHGGNEVPGSVAIYETQLRYRTAYPDLWIALASWMVIAGPQIAAIAALEQKQVTHACELETSMILRLAPRLVRMDLARGATIPFESAFYTFDPEQTSRVSVPRTFEQISATGALGHPEVATAEKGEALFATAAQEIVAFVREFAHWQPIVPT
jgi:creatinine amidohydrolase